MTRRARLRRAAQRLGGVLCAVAPVLLAQGCAVAGATAGAAISLTGAVVATGVSLSGKAIGAGIDAVSGAPDAPHASDGSGIVVRERIRPADAPAARRCAPAAGEAAINGCR